MPAFYGKIRTGTIENAPYSDGITDESLNKPNPTNDFFVLFYVAFNINGKTDVNCKFYVSRQ